MKTGTPDDERVMRMLSELGGSVSVAAQRGLPLCEECGDLVSIGLDMFGREQRLERRTASQWRAMVEAARVEGVELAAISGFRSFGYQREIIARKLASGIAIEEIMRVNALPGFSEHHTGRAIDIGAPGFPPLTEEFEQTAAFKWLEQRGRDFEFHLSYPRGNPFGIIYEPWHWAMREKSIGT